MAFGIVQELQNVAANQFTNVVESQSYKNIDTNALPRCLGRARVAGGIELSFTEPDAGARYTVEASTSLLAWTKLMSRTSTGAASPQFTDLRSTNYTSRFYRLQVP